jgi:tetratricopeptide (TPR) repeat protein
MKKGKYILILGLIVVLAGCGEDFLDITNQNELSSDNFYTKIENFDLALNGTYDAVKNLDLFGQNFYVQTLVALPHESDYWNAQCRNEVISADGNVYIAWRGFYRIVARANDILENAPEFAASEITTAEQEQLDQIVAQAHFLRGFAYFHMVRLWGEESYAVDSSRLAVPLILKVASTRDEMMIPRASVGKVYQQIIADFEAAEAVLPESWDANNIARVNRYAVKGFLGQVYLYMERYDESKAYFDEVLGNPAFGLVPFSQYEDLFQGKVEFSKESLWELNYTIDMQQNIWENGLGSGIALVLAPPGRGWSNCTPHGVNIERFGSDPRLKICTFDPTELCMTTEGVMAPAGESEFNYTGHSFKKYVPKDYSVYSTNRNSGINFHMMRMADVYLMYAEVMNKLGQDAVAAEYMNKVRRRAYGFDYHSAEPSVDYTGIAGIQLRDSIREERFRELFAEGHRWYDIVRWKIVETEVLKYNEKRVTQGEIIFNPKDYYYPIPLQEVDNNVKMTPSTGY